jgi:hypothetical protein
LPRSCVTGIDLISPGSVSSQKAPPALTALEGKGKLTDGRDPSEPKWAGHPLYRPDDNLVMLRDGLARPTRMSTRNMW